MLESSEAVRGTLPITTSGLHTIVGEACIPTCYILYVFEPSERVRSETPMSRELFGTIVPLVPSYPLALYHKGHTI